MIAQVAGFLAALLFGVAAAGAQGGEGDGPRVIAALNQNQISITANFTGTEIFVFGAIAREGRPDAEEPPLGLVIRIAGPSGPLVVRRKDRVAGVWVNAAAETVDVAPTYYAIAATDEIDRTISFTDDLRWRISLENALRLVAAQSEGEERDAFLDAVARLKGEAGLYVIQPGGVDLREDTLFSARFALPANIVAGAYRATIFLTRDRAVIDVYEADIDVAKAGLERWLFDLSRRPPRRWGGRGRAGGRGGGGAGAG
ncbi:MAG: TIGR02186 family protein, partial [Rubrimonas sp.]